LQKNFIMDFVTPLGLVAAFCTTISFLPQAIKTIRTKNTSGISLAMYALFTTGTLFWLIYGILSHSLPVALANAVTLLFALIILGYKIKYR
jgi:MtN3 and saliva related transmembrane protein